MSTIWVSKIFLKVGKCTGLQGVLAKYLGFAYISAFILQTYSVTNKDSTD